MQETKEVPVLFSSFYFMTHYHLKYNKMDKSGQVFSIMIARLCYSFPKKCTQPFEDYFLMAKDIYLFQKSLRPPELFYSILVNFYVFYHNYIPCCFRIFDFLKKLFLCTHAQSYPKLLEKNDYYGIASQLHTFKAREISPFLCFSVLVAFSKTETYAVLADKC